MSTDKLARLGLRAAASAGLSNPDAALLADMAALQEAERSFGVARLALCGQASRRPGGAADAERAFFAAAARVVELRERVAATPAQTRQGVLEKLRHVMDRWDDGETGTFVELPVSAIRDALAVAFGINVSRPAPMPRFGAGAWL